MTTRAVDPADLRAQIARLQVPLYRLAATVGVHPGRLGQMLNERLPLPLDVAERINEALGRREAPTG
jgi:plasmid maintenance system antidote protein VapI